MRLTKNGVENLILRKDEEFGKSHLLQVYDIKSGNNEGKCKKTMLISDGINFIKGVSTVLTTIQDYDIIDLTEYRLTSFKGVRILIPDKAVLAFTGIKSVLGSPIEYNGKKSRKQKNGPLIPGEAIKASFMVICFNICIAGRREEDGNSSSKIFITIS